MGAEKELLVKVTTTADLAGANALDSALQRVMQTAATAAQQIAQAAHTEQAAMEQAAAEGAELQREAKAAAESIRGIIEADKAAAEAHAKALAEAARQTEAAAHQAEHFFEALKQGIGIDFGHRIVEGIAEIPKAFQEALAEGVRFDAEMEKLGINFGAAMRASDPTRFLNFAQAREAGVEALETIRQKANQLGLDFTEVAHGFSINLAALREGGVKDTQEQIDLIIRLNQITAAKGIGGQQSQRDIIDLLQGRGERTIFGKELEPLGITNESIKQAREMGTLADLILGKTEAYGEAAAASADTFTAAQQRLKNETQQLYGEIARPVFDELKIQYQALAAEIEKPEVAEALKGLGYDISTIVEVGGDLVQFAVRNAGALTTLGEAVGVVVFAMAAYKAAQLFFIVGGWAATMVAETLALGTETAAIEAQTLALGELAAAKGIAGGAGIAEAAGAAAWWLPAAGVTAGSVGGTVAAGLLPGAAIYGVRQHLANEEGRENIEAGEQSGGQSDKLASMLREIEAATTIEERLQKRKELTDYLTEKQAELTKLTAEQAEDLANAGRDEHGRANALGDDERVQKIADLQVYIRLLENANRESGKLAGSNPLADPEVRKRAEAEAAYQNSPENLLAEARKSGDQTAIEDAEYNAKVAARAPQIEKRFPGLSPEQARKHAEDEIGDADQQKQDEEAKKEEERLAKEIQAEADEAVKKEEREDAADAKKAERDAKAATDATKQYRDAIAKEKEQTEILEARAKGNDDLADKLQAQMDIQSEITRLMKEGVGYQEAMELATEKVNALGDEKVRKEDQRDAARKSKKDDGDYKIFGYTNPNADNSAGLHTEGLDGKPSRDRFGGSGSAASERLSGPDPVRAALDAAPDQIPAFSGYHTAQLSSLFADSPLGDLFGSPTPTATAGFAPLAHFSPIDPSYVGGTSGGDAASDALTGFGTSAKQGADSVDGFTTKLMGAADSAAKSLDTLTQKLNGLGKLTDTISTLDRRVQSLEQAVGDIDTTS